MLALKAARVSWSVTLVCLGIWSGLSSTGALAQQGATIGGLTWVHRDLGTWSEARRKCERMNLRMPEALEIKEALNQGLTQAFPALMMVVGSGNMKAIWSAEASDRPNSFYLVHYYTSAADGTIRAVEESADSSNDFHILCVDGDANRCY